MKTDLPVGTYFRFRYRGQYDYGRICHDEEDGGLVYSLLLHSDIPLGETVHDCVWKGTDKLESRGTFKFKGKRKGDR